jgi:hypothetical protein
MLSRGAAGNPSQQTKSTDDCAVGRIDTDKSWAMGCVEAKRRPSTPSEEKGALCTSKPPTLRASGSSAARPGKVAADHRPVARFSLFVALFHDLIPLLAARFRVIAPDYPAMGYSEAQDSTIRRPTAADVAIAIDAFIAQLAGPGTHPMSPR